MNSSIRVNLTKAPKYNMVKIEELHDYLTIHGLRVVRSYWPRTSQPVLIVEPISTEIQHSKSGDVEIQSGIETEKRS